MATISFDIPDSFLPRVTDAFASEYNYSATLPNGTANPVTKTQFAKAQIIEFVKQVTRNYEGNIAAASSRAAKVTEINGINIV
jgi:hypothetical protein